MILPGRQLDKYEVETVLGQGGMADVYVVRHTILGTRHAMKVLHTDAKLLAPRLMAEGKVQAALRHPSIVRVTDTVDVDGQPGLVMDLIDGRGLDAHLEEGTFDLGERITIFRAILDGVAAAHALGVIHRDLKPANVLIPFENGRPVPKITDFGLVKVLEDGAAMLDPLHTRPGIPVGTPAYMSPEQVEGLANIDRRSDVFCLGIMLYELVSDRRPFERATVGETYAAVSTATYPPITEIVPDTPPELVTTIDACLHRNRDDRPASAAEIAALLDGMKAPRAATPPRAAVLTGFAVAAITAGIAVLGWIALGGAPSSPPPAPKVAEDVAKPSESAAPAANLGPPAAVLPPVAAPSPPVAPPRAAAPRIPFTGAKAVQLVDAAGRTRALPAALPPGSYEIRADFGQGFAPAGRGAVQAGSRIACDAAFETCQVE